MTTTTPASSLLLLSLVAAAAFTSSSSALRVTETEDEVAARDDGELELSCTGDQQWDYCRWSFRSRSCARPSSQVMTDEAAACGIDAERISWRGMPSIDNRCTIAVSRPTSADSGVWTCQLIQGQDKVEVAPKNYQVTVYSKSSVSFASRPHQKMMVGQVYVVECAGTGGVPSADLSASVAPRTMAAEVMANQEADWEEWLDAIEDGGDGMIGGTVTRLFKYRPGPEHTQMVVKCRASQRDKFGQKIYDDAEAVSPFEVVFAPLKIQEDDNETSLNLGVGGEDSASVETFFIDEGETAEVNMRFSANPPPSNDQVVWHIVRQSTNYSFTLRGGMAKDRFEAKYIETRGSDVTATLLIHQASYDDLLNYCYLEASNELGRAEFQFALEPTPIPTVEPYEESGETSGMSVGAIVGLVIGVLFLFVAVIILIVFLRKSQRCCFAPKKKSFDGDDYMTVAQNDNVNARGESIVISAREVAPGDGGGGDVHHEHETAVRGAYESRDEVDVEDELTAPMAAADDEGDADEVAVRRGEERRHEGSDDGVVGESPAGRAKRAESYQMATAAGGRSMSLEGGEGGKLPTQKEEQEVGSPV